jgi:hypothetical protein
VSHKICHGKAKSIWQEHYKNIKEPVGGIQWGDCHAYRGVKRIRMKCELCGRRILSSIWNNEDGDIIHILPPHKPKHWWKGKRAKWNTK